MILTVGDLDCLRDNSIYLAHKIIKAKQSQHQNNYTKLYIYKDLPHGYLCLDWPGIPLPFLS